MTDSLKNRVTDDMKSAMRARDKQTLAAIRLILAEIKQQEVDTRSEVSNKQIIAILDKMCKQRRDSIAQYDKAGREDLSNIEKQELVIIRQYMPKPLTEKEIENLVQKAIQISQASSMRDMGKVMGYIKPKAQGRADIGRISGLVRKQLS